MELILNGYLCIDNDDHPALTNNENALWYHRESIAREIQNRLGSEYLDKGLGEEITYIPDCSLTIWYTNKKCTFDEAQEALCNHLDGCMTVNVVYLGYSEYTITGYDLETFKIGGHDLRKEFNDHIGEYCWIRITT